MFAHVLRQLFGDAFRAAVEIMFPSSLDAFAAGLYEKYGYRYMKDIVNYGNGVDRLYVKDIRNDKDV